MKVKSLIIMILFSLTLTNKIALKNFVTRLDPDITNSIEEIITSKKYFVETHYVTTSDGFILKIFRIPGSKKLSKPSHKNVVLFAHGLLDSSDSWVANNEELSLPLRLVLEGYDAWIMNTRGNKHSNNHEFYNKSNKKFWNFSFHEMGLLDVTAVTDYILNLTKKEKLTYIGHSQGCAQFYVLCSLRPEYCKEKYKGMIALGPAVYVDNTEALLLKALITIKLDKLVLFMGINSVFETSGNTNLLTKLLCTTCKVLCNGFVDLVADGPDSKNNQERVQVFFSHFPGGTSVKDLIHIITLVRNKDFVTIDGDRYPIENFKVPVFIKIGNTDKLVTPIDGYRLGAKMGENGVLREIKEYEGMGHSTFFMTDGKDTYIQDVIDNVKSLN